MNRILACEPVGFVIIKEFVIDRLVISTHVVAPSSRISQRPPSDVFRYIPSANWILNELSKYGSILFWYNSAIVTPLLSWAEIAAEIVIG